MTSLPAPDMLRLRDALPFWLSLLMIPLALTGATVGGWTVLLLPFSLLPLAMLGLGCAWFLSALGVYLRDVGYIVSVALQALFFATPIFYPVSAIPEAYRGWMMLNPLTPMIDLVRGHLIIGTPGDPTTWACALAIGLVAMALGYAWFMVTRKGFADVL